MRILLVEDDAGLGDAVRDHIAASGHLADWAQRLGEAVAFCEAQRYELILLDLMLPDGTGLEFLRQLRDGARAGRPLARNAAAPVIILTARDRITDRIAGLDAGADDYLVKPFDLAELSARINAVARRYSGNPNPTLHVAGFEIDVSGRTIIGPEGAISLSQREWVILERLLRKPNQIVTKSQLEDLLYSFDAEVESNTIEVYVSRLRKKLGRDMIETHRGLGYRLVSSVRG
jgi:two-component system OmpR family response regulator